MDADEAYAEPCDPLVDFGNASIGKTLEEE